MTGKYTPQHPSMYPISWHAAAAAAKEQFQAELQHSPDTQHSFWVTVEIAATPVAALNRMRRLRAFSKALRATQRHPLHEGFARGWDLQFRRTAVSRLPADGMLVQLRWRKPLSQSLLREALES